MDGRKLVAEFERNAECAAGNLQIIHPQLITFKPEFL
jgi:hypothetical protein